MEFSEKLLLLRTENRRTQQQLADAIGVTLRQYQRFEHGEQKPGFDNLRRLADFYQVSADWLLGRSERRDILP